MTREQIIDLINQYIYTNGNQRITAAQLNEILLEIANAFAMEGEGGAGIDSVLEAGNEVTDGRTIVNVNGGSVLLDASFASEDITLKYVGFEVLVPTYQTFDYFFDQQVFIGTLKRSSPSRNLFNMIDKRLNKGEVIAMTRYLSGNSGGDEPGIFSAVYTEATGSQQKITAASMESAVSYVLDNETGARQRIEIAEITHEITQGPQTSSHIQDPIQIKGRVTNGDSHFDSVLYPTKQQWANQSGSIGEINNAGVKLENGKSISMVSTGSSELLIKADGPNASIKVNGSTTTSLGLDANYIGLRDGANVYGSFGYDACQLMTVFNVTRAGSSSLPSITSTHTGTGNNVAVYANAINGTSNIAFLADNGDLVVKNGSAMIGFASDVTPDARLDVKAQGATSSDLVLRIRNSAGTSNIMEVRGDGDILVGTGLLTAGTGIGSNLIHGFSIDGCRVDSDMEYQGTDQYNYGRIHLRGTDFDTEGTNVINIANGTAPATDNADAFRFYSADQTAGNAAPHFRTENGAVIKIYQETTAVGDATLVGGAGTPLTDTDTFDGYTLKQIVKALRNLGLLD